MAMYPCLSLPSLSFPTLTGSIVTFNSQYAGLPLKAHTVSLVAQQAGKGMPSPSSPLPISGWDAIHIGSDAKYAGFINFNQIVQNGNFASTSNWIAVSSTFSVSDNVATVHPSALNGRIGQCVPFPLGHKMLTILDFKGASGITYGFNGLVPATEGTGDWVELSKIMESPVQSNLAYLFMGHQSNDGCSNPFYVKNVCLFDLTQMFGSTIADYIYSLEQGTAGAGVAFFRKLFPNDYYDYNTGTLTTVSAVNGVSNSMFTIPIGSTIYGGTFDAITGILTVTHEYLNLDSLNWSNVNSTNDTSSTGLSGTIKPPPTNNNKVNMICTSFEVVACNDISDITIMVNTSSTIIIRYSGYAGYTGSQVKSALSGVYIAYELDTPTTIQLPPCPIDTLEVNNIWADTGDTTLQYPKFG